MSSYTGERFIEPDVSPWAIAKMSDLPMDTDLDDAPNCRLCADEGYRPDGRPCDHYDPRRERLSPTRFHHPEPAPKPIPDPWKAAEAAVPPPPF